MGLDSDPDPSAEPNPDLANLKKSDPDLDKIVRIRNTGDH
jgi:hypothetical protein